MDKITVNLPVHYPVTYTKKRSRAVHTALLPDVVQVDIAAVSVVDAPIVVDANLLLDTKTVPIRRRRLGNVLLAETRRAAWPVCNPEHIAGLLDTSKASLKLLGETIPKALWAEKPSLVSDNLPFAAEVVLDNGRETMADAVRAACSKFVFVDGILHEQSLPPAISIVIKENYARPLLRFGDLRRPDQARSGVFLRLSAWEVVDELRCRLNKVYPCRAWDQEYVEQSVSLVVRKMDLDDFPAFPEAEVNVRASFESLRNSLARGEHNQTFRQTKSWTRDLEQKYLDSRARIDDFVEHPGRAGARLEAHAFLDELVEEKFYSRLHSYYLKSITWDASLFREGLELSLDPVVAPDVDQSLSGLLL